MDKTTNVHTVNGHIYREIEIFDDLIGMSMGSFHEVKTPNCGWDEVHICEKACDASCRNAQEFFDEVGIEY